MHAQAAVLASRAHALELGDAEMPIQEDGVSHQVNLGAIYCSPLCVLAI